MWCICFWMLIVEMQSRLSWFVCRYTLGMSEVVAMELLSGHIPAIEEWCRRFMHSEPHHEMGNIDFKRFLFVACTI